MADIDVVKKPSRTWLWVLMAIIAALVLWFVVMPTRGPEGTGGALFDSEQQYAAAAAREG
jgi:hypothetical protein